MQRPCETWGPYLLPNFLIRISAMSPRFQPIVQKCIGYDRMYEQKLEMAYIPWTRPQRGSLARSRTGAKHACIPIDRASEPIALPTLYIRSVSNVAAIPIVSGNMDCLKEPTPCRHSPDCMKGIFTRDLSKLSSWRSLYWDLLVGYQSCKTPIGAPGADSKALSFEPGVSEKPS